MPDNRRVPNNAVANQSADNIEEAVWQLKINDDPDRDAAQSGPYPDRPGEPNCTYYLRTGICGYGSNCRYNHPPYAAQAMEYKEELPQRVGQPDCGFFLKTGTCKYGSTCKYHHPKDRHGAGPISYNILGMPMRQEEKSCPYYMRTGSCKFGIACKFHHPQPASLGAVLPVSGPAAFGSVGSSFVPSSGLSYVGGLPTWPLPRMPYISGPRLQGTQAYMPVVLSPSAGVVPAQGWNTYVGNMGPMSSTSILGSNHIYSSRNQGELGSGGQVHLSSTSSANFPERPDQPECRYFMNTGFCKYGSDCKYHHPTERIRQLPTQPFGLPSRPGQAVCSDYSMYGLCKYGPTCKFDHPFLGYPYNYSLSLPAMSIHDSSLLNYQRTPLIVHSSETSPSTSLKLTDWVRKSDDSSKKDQNSDAKILEDSHDEAGSPPESLPTTSEASPDRSDSERMWRD